MNVLEYINNNKEWLFSGIGVTVLGALGLLFRSLWNRRKAETQITPKGPLPAFNLDGSTARLTRTPIVGGVPHGLVKATGGAIYEMTDSLVIVGGPNVEYPAPTGELAATSNAELRQMANELASQLLQFHRAISLEQVQAFSENRPNGLQQMSARHNQRFNATLRNRSLQLLCEMLHRLPPIERRPLPVEMRCGIDAAIHGNLDGSQPAAGLASFFQLLSSKLK